jgi:hypothetical protein
MITLPGNASRVRLVPRSMMAVANASLESKWLVERALGHSRTLDDLAQPCGRLPDLAEQIYRGFWRVVSDRAWGTIVPRPPQCERRVLPPRPVGAIYVAVRGRRPTLG